MPDGHHDLPGSRSHLQCTSTRARSLLATQRGPAHHRRKKQAVSQGPCPMQSLRIPIAHAVQKHAMHASPPPSLFLPCPSQSPRARVSRVRVYPPPPNSCGDEPKTQRSESRKRHPIYSIGAPLVDVLETSAISGVFRRLDNAGLGAGARYRLRHRSRCTCRGADAGLCAGPSTQGCTWAGESPSGRMRAEFWQDGGTWCSRYAGVLHWPGTGQFVR